MTPSHICARKLDDKSLAAILSMNKRPNVVDGWGRTPMYCAMTEGVAGAGQDTSEAMDRCLSILESYGGDLEVPIGFRHPVSHLACIWRSEELSAVLKHVKYRYPLITDQKRIGMSVSAFYQYPVHSALVALRKKIKSACEGENVQKLWAHCSANDNNLNR